MKLLKIESCYECQDHIVGHCWHVEIGMERDFTEGDEKQIVVTGFPEWCPLGDVNE